MDIVSLIIQLLSGALGGNAAGALLKNLSLGTVGNSLAGIIGGGLGGQLLPALLPVLAGSGGSLDPATIIAQVANGGIGGGLLMIIVGLLKRMLAR